MTKEEVRARNKIACKKHYARYREKINQRRAEIKALDPQRFKRYQDKYRATHREAKRLSSTLSTYKISKETHEKLLQTHAGKCAICRRERKLVIDHDHTAGHVRGLLCRACNVALGLFGEKPLVLKRAIEYLDTRSCGNF